MTAPPRPNPQHFPPVTSTVFIVEASDLDGETSVRLFDEANLIGWLASNIEHQHYSGDEYPAPKIARYEPADGQTPASLTELVMSSGGHSQDGADWLHYRYLLHEKADAEAFGACEENKVAEFTVTIDGRV